MSKQPYLLTETAEQDFRNAKNWSLKRWGKERTKAYFKDLHETAIKIATHHLEHTDSKSLTNSSELKVWPIREHYLIYLHLKEDTMVIVALLRQTQDIPNILDKNRFVINRAIKELTDH